jgi:hypothetical protein
MAPPCHHCEVACYLAEETRHTWYSASDVKGILALARSWHRKCEGKGCGCACEKKRGLLRNLWRLRPAYRMVVSRVPGSLDCPGCNEAELEPFGGKYRCPRCFLIIPCCETERPCETSRS